MLQFTFAAPAMLPLNGKSVRLDFAGAEMRSDVGLTLLRQTERGDDLAGLVACHITGSSTAWMPRAS